MRKNEVSRSIGRMYKRLLSVTRHTLNTIGTQARHSSSKKDVSALPKRTPEPLPFKNQSRDTPQTSESVTPAPAKTKHGTVKIALTLFNIFLVTHLITVYVGSIRPCTGPSMLPTISWEGDWVVISKLHRYGRGVSVGDLISYHHPIRQGVSGIKRVVGLPGDFVLRDTPRNTFGEEMHSTDESDASMIQVPDGHCWVVGDNLGASRDSRHFGPLPLALIKGKVVARAWPRGALFKNALQEPDLDAV